MGMTKISNFCRFLVNSSGLFCLNILLLNNCCRTLSYSNTPPKRSYLRNAVNSSDFYRLVTTSDIFVDKSLLIEKYLRNNVSMFLITRPKKFAKTTNTNMLKRFLEIETDDNGIQLPPEKRLNRKLFEGGEVTLNSGQTKTLQPLKIASSEYCMQQQGTVPAIYVTFADIMGDTYEEIENKTRKVIGKLYSSYKYLQEYAKEGNKVLSDTFKKKLNRYFTDTYDKEDLADSISFLTKILYEHFKKRVHVFFDDYDIPINNLFANLIRKAKQEHATAADDIIFEKAFRSQEFIDSHRLLGRIIAQTKYNYAMDKSLIIGKLQLDDMLNGIHMLVSYSIFDKEFSEFYGFTQGEVDRLLHEKSLINGRGVVRVWYSGYNFCDTVMYNTWSVVNYIAENGTVNYYWVDGSNMRLMNDLLKKDFYSQTELANLTNGQSVVEYIRKGIEYPDVLHDGLIHILLFSGYLTVVKKESGRASADRWVNHPYELTIPNDEVKHIYLDRILKDIKIINVPSKFYTFSPA